MLTARRRVFGAGRIADRYRDLRGPVEEICKPHRLIYSVAAATQAQIDPARVLCIGDSPAQDVRGAHGAGFAAVLLRTGIHADLPLLELLDGAPASDRPDFVLERFAW